MRSLNIKKAAAVAAGTALLVGAALAAVPDAAKDASFYWDGGNTNVQIVVGGDALVSDGVAAAKLAAVIGSKAYTAEGGTTTPDATGMVKIGVVGGASTLPESSVRSDYAWNTLNTDLVLGSSKGLAKGTITFNANEYDYEEEVLVEDTTTFSYNEGTDYHGMGFTTTKPNKILYKFKFLDVFPNPNGNLNQTVTIPFLGESYVINKLKTTEAELVKGDEVRLGIGQQSDVTIGDETYTVTLDSADLDETTTPNTGQATVTVSGGDLTSAVTLQLDTANEQNKNAGDVLVFLQSVAKSYTPGQGGSATLRVGGSVLSLKDGQTVTEFPDWKASITTSGTEISELRLVYNVNLQAKDVVDTVDGPDDYFQVKYMGDEVTRGQWAAETITVGTTDTDDFALDTLTYTDFGYEKEYTIELNDDLNQTAFLARNATGIIGSGNATETNYTMLIEDDVFFVYNTPVKITSFSTSTTAANAQVQFTIGYGGSNPTTKTVKASDTACDVDQADPMCTCTAVDMIAGNQINFNWTWNSTGIPYMNVYGGADDILNTKYGQVTFVVGNGTFLQNHSMRDFLGPYNATLIDKGGTGYTVSFVNATTDPGVQTTGINQQTSNGGDDNNKYGWYNVTWVEALDSQTVEFTNPENNPRTMRIAIIRGSIEGEAGESVTTVDSDDTLPYDVTSEVTVKELECTADAVATGVSFGTVSDSLVVTDSVDPAGNAIVIGGHYVNRLAVGMTEGTLTAAGTKMTEMSGNTLYVAGYTAADTTSAVNELITAIKAL